MKKRILSAVLSAVCVASFSGCALDSFTSLTSGIFGTSETGESLTKKSLTLMENCESEYKGKSDAINACYSRYVDSLSETQAKKLNDYLTKKLKDPDYLAKTKKAELRRVNILNDSVRHKIIFSSL